MSINKHKQHHISIKIYKYSSDKGVFKSEKYCISPMLKRVFIPTVWPNLKPGMTHLCYNLPHYVLLSGA